MAILQNKERPNPGTKECLPRMRVGTAQDRGQGGGYLRQRHDDDCRGDDMRFPLPEIRHDKAGFEALVCLHGQAKDSFFDNIHVDMSTTTWFDADMCAAFGAILYRLSENVNTVKLTGFKSGVANICQKMDF